MVAVAEGYRIASASTGRVRIHLPNWGGQARAAIEEIVQQIPGVTRVAANALTGSLLINYDESVTNSDRLLDSVQSIDINDPEPLPVEERANAAPPRDRVEQVEGQRQRVRIAVTGLSRNPSAAHRIEHRIDQLPGVHRVHASPLTGRVLVEFADDQMSLARIHDELDHFQDYSASHEHHVSPPGELSPLIQRAIRLGGASIGLGILSFRRLLGLIGPPTASAIPAISAELISVLRAFPATRNGIRSLLGNDTADAFLSLGSIAALMLSGKTLGLAVAGVEGLRLVTELYSRRVAWQRYEQRLQAVPTALPGSVVRMEDGDFLPFDGTVMTGTGTVLSSDGKPVAVTEGDHVPSGPIIYGGPLEIQLNEQIPWNIPERPARPTPGLLERYLKGISPFSVAYAVMTGLATRSWYGALGALLMVNPRVAVIGRESADVSASAQVLRSGATVVGMRPDHPIRLPDVLVLDSPRLLTERLELDETLSLRDDLDNREASQIAAAIASEAGSPWGDAFSPVRDVKAVNGAYNSAVASAEIDGVRYYLRPYRRRESHPEGDRMRNLGRFVLVLSDERSDDYAALISLRPALATGAQELVRTCQEHHVDLVVVTSGDSSTAAGLAERAGVTLVKARSPLHVIQNHQSRGEIVACVSDSAQSGPMFDAADLSIGLTSGSSDFPARPDLIAPDLVTVSAVVEAGIQRDRSVRDSVFLSGLANLFGIGWGLTRARTLGHTTAGVHVASLAAIGIGWARLSGGELSRSSLTRLTDPRPERWGRQGVRSVISAFDTSVHGLSTEEAAKRMVQSASEGRGPSLLGAIYEQASSPLILTLAASGALSIFYGTPIDSILIAATIALNVGVAAWQEHSTDEAAERLEELSSSSATVIRDGRPMELSADEVVPGDVLMLVAGDRVPADARIIRAENLEVDESALTGESLPVQKTPSGASEENRIVLEGSDVTRGSGRAVVVAVGRKTRMGATAAALDVDDDEHSPLGRRLNQMLRGILPLAAVGGAIVMAAGMIRGRRLTTQIALGTTVAIGALPEGLPLLAKMGEAAVARRLAGRHALVRRLSSVEALGRVDIACTDKTGTLTEGRLVVDAIATLSQERKPAPNLGNPFREILLTASLASPHPDAPDAQSHQTDIAVMEAARRAGIRSELDAERLNELSFDPERSSHVTVIEDRLCIKGAFEALIDRCERIRFNDEDIPLDTAERERLLARAEELADRGQRVLMVAEGPPDTSPEDPEGLTALGFVGIRDPLRPTVPDAVRRCHLAGVRVVMITGDHPTTARAIGREAGILGDGNGQLLTGTEIAELSDEELDQRLEHATIIARATPLDKLRIVESFQRLGHCVAMTGDGVNDAPALRLADVGVAMGDHGTDVARHAADLVLTNDDFSTLVESFVEGRVFWSNIRRALGLLLGGNVGEIGLMAIPNLLGMVSPLSPRQVLAVNMITDALPALAVTLQEPEHRNLATLAREGAAALGVPLRNDIAFRAIATQVPSLIAYFISLRFLGPVQSRSVAFASVIATQLAQTFDAVWTNQEMSKPMVAAMAGSALFLGTSLTVPFLQVFLGLSPLSLTGWLLAGAAALAAVPLSRLLARIDQEMQNEEETGRPELAPAA